MGALGMTYDDAPPSTFCRGPVRDELQSQTSRLLLCLSYYLHSGRKQRIVHLSAVPLNPMDFKVLQAAGQNHVVHALVEIVADFQVLQAAGQSRVVQALVEEIAEHQTLQAAGQSCVVQTLVECI